MAITWAVMAVIQQVFVLRGRTDDSRLRPVVAVKYVQNITAASALNGTLFFPPDRADSVDRHGSGHFKVTAQFPLGDSNCQSRNASSTSAASVRRRGRLMLLHGAT